jgi:filamentous hemagglutinin family protein
MGTIHGGMTFLLTTAWSMVATKIVPKVTPSKKYLLMKSPIFFSKGRTVRFWIQIVLVLALLRIALVPSALYANPTGEQVVGGVAGFNRPDAATLIVNQNTDRAVINWNSFSIANGELTKFVQPSSSSAVLNRVVTANPSAIYGTLQANGNVYLINPGGVLVGAGGVVNTASFVASTHDVNTEEFMKGGQLNFQGNSDASVVNQGNITAREGDVFLIAKEVKNEGQLMAKDGTVGMVSGTEVSLQAVGQGNYKVRLLAAETDPTSPRTSQGEGGASKGSAEIVNEGVIQAANAVLEAKGSYLPMAIKNTGVIEATGLVENGDGSVTLTGGEGDILNTGVVAALQRSLDGQRETGGSIMMTAKNVTSDIGSLITAAGKDGGGLVKLRSADTTILRGSIEVVGASESAKGGKVQLLGERVGLFDQAKVDASGGAGGGEVLVGGDYLGKNPNVPNAQAVVLGSEARIISDATSNGNGGRVILWSDEYTGFYGDISAQGGISGGDGGFVETSSKINLQAFGSGNVGSKKGLSGNWLLDPANVTISSLATSGMNNEGPNPGGGGTTPTGNIWYTTAAGATLNDGTLSNLLESANVAVLTTPFTPVPNENGDITVATGASVTWSSGTTLRLRAGNQNNNTGIITINGTIDGGASGTLELYSPAKGAAIQGPLGEILVGSLLLNNLGSGSGTGVVVGGTLLNGANVVDQIAATGLDGTVSFRDTGGFNGATGLIISTVTAGDVTGYTSATSDSTTIAATTAVGIISAGTVNLTSTGPITQTAKIDMSGGDFCAVTLSGTVIQVGGVNIGTSIGADILLDNTENQVSSLNLATLNSTGDLANAANIKFTEFQGFTIDNFGSVVTAVGLERLNGSGTAPAGGIITGRAITIVNPVTGAADVFGGSIVLTGGADGTTRGGLITQTLAGSIIGSNLGLLGDYNYDFTVSSDNNISTLAAFLEDAADLDYIDSDGFQVFFVNFMRNTTTAVMIPGIRLEGFGTDGTDQYETGDLNLTTLSGVEFNGIQLTSTGDVITPNGTVTARTITPDNQYSLLPSFTGVLAPGHIEASGNVTITVEDGDGVIPPLIPPGTTQANRFTLQEGIHLFAGMGPDLTNFGNSGIAIIRADNMIIGSDTRPDLAMHGLIMTGNVNEAGTINYGSSTALLPFTAQRQAFIVTPKADYDVTPDPGQLQLSQAELRRINTSRLQIDSAYTSATDFAVDVRTPLNLYGLYDTVEVSGIFPTNPGVNRLELIAFGGDAGGGARGNVQVSGDISSDVNQLPMDIFLSASAADQSSGGFVNVNGGLRSYGGQIGLQGQNVNINAAVNANNPNQADGLGLVAIFPGQGPTAANPGTGVTPISLGTKVDEYTLGILRTELALITAGTVQIGDVELRPAVLDPVNPFTRTSITGTNPLWKNFIQANDAGPITVTDLISNLSFNTLALVTSGDRTNPTNYALSQDSQAGIQVAGLFVVGNPFAATTDYVLGGAFNEIDYLAVALGLATASGAPSGDLLLVNQKGLVGGNGGEVARIQQQWDQNYTRTTTDPFLSTGVGLVVARALSITASGSVSIYETVPTGVTGLGYIGHVASNPNALANGSNGYAQVGNQIGLVGDSTSGLAINVIQSAVGETGANTVWAAAARGLSVNDLTTQFAPGLPPIYAEAGILTNGGQVTLEGNAIEIATSVDRGVGGNTITIDTTGASTSDSASAVAPSGARVVIRPATGQNGFQNRAGSGAYDPNLQNSPLAGAPVEMNLGTASATFLDASLGTIFLASTALQGFYLNSGGLVEGGAIRSNVLEIGRNVDSGTASGKISITANIGSANNWMSTLLEALHVISGGSVEDSGMMVTGGTPNTITMNLDGENVLNLDGSGLGGLAVDSLGAVAVQADVSLVAIDAGANNNVRFIDTAGGVAIGVVDGVSGVLANTFYLDVAEGIAQASGATIQATGGGVSLRSTGAIRLDQDNDFNLVAAYANGTANQPIYLRTSGPMSVSIFGSGQPGGQPTGVAGITGSNVTLVAGGDLQQSDLAQITATSSFLATVLDGSDVLLNSTLNDLGDSPVIAALKTDGTLGNIANLTLVNNGAFDLGSAGVLTADLAAAGSGWTEAPDVLVNGTPGFVSTVMGLSSSIAVSSGGAGYQSAPLVTLTDGVGGTGVGAKAVAIVDSNPLSSTYGQVTSINVTNPGTGYGTQGTVTATLSGGGATQEATVADGTITLAIQRLNVNDPGSGYTSTPTITFSGGGGGSGATATSLIGGTGGYVASGSTTVLGGITGDLDISTAAGDITDGSGLSVAGTSTLNSTAGSIILDSMNNNLVGAIQATSSIDTTIKNANSLVLGNFNVGGNLELGSQGNIYQVSTGSALVVGGTSQFYATTTAASGGTPSGVVTLNNSLNSFTGTVTATGTRVVIRDSTALELGNIIATTSLTATAGVGDITQFGGTTIGNSTYTTGPAAFAAANGQSITVGNVGNYFGSTVSFAALSGTLANVSVLDTTALDLQALDITGNLVATGAGLTQSGVFLVDGTSTLTSTGTGNNLVLANVLNQFGNGAGDTVTITSAGNATLVDSGVLEMGASTITGNLSLTAGSAFTQTGSIIVNGTGTSSITTTAGVVTLGNLSLTAGNLAVSSAGNFSQAAGTSLTVNGTGTSSISTTAGNITFGNAGGAASSSFAGNLSVVSLGGTIGQAAGSITVTGTSSFNSNNGAGTIALVGSGGNNFVGAVTLSGGVTQITDGVGGLTLGTITTGNLTAISTGGGVLNLGQGNVTGTLVATASNGDITQNGILTVTGATTLTAGTGNIILGSANSLANVTVNSATDVTLRNIALTAGTLLYPTLPAALQNLTLIFDNSAATLSANPSNLTGNLSITAGGGAISSVNPISVSGSTTLSAGSSAITFGNAANDFVGTVTIGGTGVVTMEDANNLTLVGQQSLNLGNITTGTAFTVSSPANITSAAGSLITTGGAITITAGTNADVIINPSSDIFLGAVTVPGIFTLRTSGGTSFDIATGTSGGFDITDTQLAEFNVGTFAPIASGALGNLNLGALTSYPGIGSISLTTEGGGSINGSGAISMNTLQLNSSGAATFSAVNQIQNLGNVTVASGGLTFRNGRGLNLTGTVSMPTGRLSLEVAGQFYNQTGQSQPLGGVAGGSVIKSLSLMGGLPNQVSGLAGFSYRYDGQMPTSGNVMSYAVSPLSMFAPGGTTIAGVDLGGTQTGGGQLNTFLTGSDNLNWMISDFGRFDMPTVKPSGMDYILYPQRVEPETKTLPAATLGQLERELGRPPTLEEIQAREVAVREAAMVRSGAILERTSFDAIEDEVDKQESAEVPAQVIDGGKPQADARGQRSEDGMQKAEVGSRPSFAPSPASAGGASQGFGSQARKTQSVKQGSNGPILRSGPIRSVAQLRPAEPSQSGNISEASAQALKLDAKSVIEQERASAEVGIAPPIAAGR